MLASPRQPSPARASPLQPPARASPHRPIPQALQQLSEEKEELHAAFAKQAAALEHSEAQRVAAEARADRYAQAIEGLQAAARDALASNSADT